MFINFGGNWASRLLSPERLALAVRLAVVTAVLVLVLGFMRRYDTVSVPDWNDQMYPAVQPGGRVLVRRNMRRAADFSRGDIVAYAARGAEGISARFGRVAGLPGDRVEVRDSGEVLVNGEPVVWGSELYVSARADLQARQEVVPEGALFLLNDKRSSALADSRKLGPIPEGAIAGKVVMSW